MKTLLSGSFILLVTAMMATLSVGCGEGIEGETGSQSAELAAGQCNAIIARSLGLSQQCNKFGCEEDGPECVELQNTFAEFFATEGCGAAFVAGELNGLAGNALWHGDPEAGEPGPIQEVLCGADFACDETCAGLRGIGLCEFTEACN